MSEKNTRRQLWAEVVLFDGPLPVQIRWDYSAVDDEVGLVIRLESIGDLEVWAAGFLEVQPGKLTLDDGGAGYLFAYGRRGGYPVRLTAEWKTGPREPLDERTRAALADELGEEVPDADASQA